VCLFLKSKRKQNKVFWRPKAGNGKEKGTEFSHLGKSGIRWKVNEFCFRNELPMLNSVLALIDGDPDHHHLKRVTLHTILNAFC
jgi:hypothetical protein